MRNIPIGEVLREKGIITQEQLDEALREQRRTQGSGKRLGSILIEKGFVTEQQTLAALGEKLNLHILPLETFPVEIDAVKKIPRSLASSYCLLAVAVTGSRLTVVINDPLNLYGIEDIRQTTGMEIDIALAERAKIEHAIEVYYSEIETKATADKIRKEEISLQQAVKSAQETTEDNPAPAIKILNSLLHHGYNIGASDIHIEIMEKELRIRLRVDGMLVPYMTLSKSLHMPIIARTKILANLDIAEKRLPQDGHFKLSTDGAEMNLRVSVIPTIYGEKAVLRFLDSSTNIAHEHQFGMNDANYKRMERMLQNPNGIIYITGPTGSGKSTTLYFILKELAERQINISTIEDPVEQYIDGINQMQVNSTTGLNFTSGLRALLRQDPDIIMVGETRDKETAGISIRSAITGHLVLSTLHTNDAISAIVRLEEMGLEPYLIANSLTGLIAQRLVRMICPHCKTAYKPTEQEWKLLGASPTQLYYGTGCPACNQTGYKGRIAVHEVVEIKKKVRHMISAREPIEEIYRYVKKKQGFATLQEEATALVLQGMTTTTELMKLTYSIE